MRAAVAVGRAGAEVPFFGRGAESGSGRAHHGEALGLGEGVVGPAPIGGTLETGSRRAPRREGGGSPPREAAARGESQGCGGSGPRRGEGPGRLAKSQPRGTTRPGGPPDGTGGRGSGLILSLCAQSTASTSSQHGRGVREGGSSPETVP